jgi:EVE domain
MSANEGAIRGDGSTFVTCNDFFSSSLLSSFRTKLWFNITSLIVFASRTHLASVALVTNSRLSVQKVSEEEWNIIREMGEL